MYIGEKIVNDGLIFGYDMDDRSSRFYKGEPTTNIVPDASNNGRFTINNNWQTYNTNHYGDGNYFSISSISNVTNNIITTTSNHTLRSFDVVNPQSTGGGVTAGTSYVVKKISDTSFSLHNYNSSQNGSQGYINPTTGFYKVHDDYILDNRIPVNSSSFPTMWHGGAHLPNSGLIKEIVNGGGYVPGTNCMRLHIFRADNVTDGMAYGVDCPVTVGDSITMSVWLKASTPTAVGKTLRYDTYFYGYASGSVGLTLGEYNKWNRYTYTWTASNTCNFISYWFPEGSYSMYDIDMADFQVEIKPHVTQFTTSNRPSTGSLIDLKRNKTMDISSVSFNSTAHPIFDGVNDYINIGVGTDYFPLYQFTLESWIKTSGLGSGMVIGGIFGFTYGLRVFVNSDGNIQFGVNDGITTTTSYITSTGSNLFNDKYHHIICSNDGTNSYMYIDGVLVVMGAASWIGTTLWSGNSVNIGRDNNDVNLHFYGSIPIVKIYNKVLSLQEIQQNYNTGRYRFGV